MKTPTVRPIEIHGYALISDDNMIAAADGLTPPTLRNEKDWEYYQNALARSDLIVFGRRSHEAEPNLRGDRRVVVSRSRGGVRTTRRRLVVEPGDLRLGDGRRRAAARGRRGRGSGRAKRLRSLPPHRLFARFICRASAGLRCPGGEACSRRARRDARRKTSCLTRVFMPANEFRSIPNTAWK